MNKVFFMNQGDFDVRAMLTMGVSAKDKNDAIGFFGTGFKYSIAIILRMGGKISVSTQSGVYKFEARRELIRGKKFDIVYMNDKEAGFTTHLGANWEPWMAYRELYCNAKDENGEISTDINENYDTIISVECSQIYKAHVSSSDYFISTKPLFEGAQAEIHEGEKPFIYYRGIAVMNSYKNSMFSYNITSNVTLTEDRTAKYDHEIKWPIQKAIQRCTDKSMLRKALTKGDHAEANISYDTDWGASDEFMTVCDELLASDKGLCEGARVLKSKLQANSGNWPEFKINDVQQMALNKAKSFLFKMDIDVDRFPIKTVTGLGDGVMGRAHEGTIYLSDMPFNMGVKQLASTLLEEWVHNKYGCDDFDRQMQNWLFDKILSVGEVLNGEPL